MSEEFRLRSVAVAAYGPATLFGLAQGSMLPVIALSAIDRGASPAIAALIGVMAGLLLAWMIESRRRVNAEYNW